MDELTAELPEGAGYAEQTERKPVTAETVSKAAKTLTEYMMAKTETDCRFLSNVRWYRLRHWEEMRKEEDDKVQKLEPKSARLFYAILNKHADYMDNYPRANILPREESDTGEASTLTSIIPAVFEQQDFEEQYSEEKYDLLIQGNGCFGVFWDGQADSGLGEIKVRRVDLLNLFWEPGIKTLQDSSNVFYVDYMNEEQLRAAYPQLEEEGNLDHCFGAFRRETEETRDESRMAMIVDWYYKRTVPSVVGVDENGEQVTVNKTVLHYVKFVGDHVLYASENEENGGNGYYWHGMYPFILDVMYPIPGQICGFGLIDVGKSEQEMIDRSDEVFFESLLDSVTPRYFVKESSGINEEEYADRTKRLVHYSGEFDNAARPVETKQIAGNYITIRDEKVEELKEVTGSRDVATGGTQSGVTAASAIAAMQESSGKPSRDLAKAAYRVHRRVVNMVIELVRQFYDVPHYFRVMGEAGVYSFITYTNAGLLPKVDPATNEPVRQPVFDIKVTCERNSPYTRLSQNALAMELYEKGLLNPMNAMQAAVVLELMDFDGKDKVMQLISRNMTLFSQTLEPGGNRETQKEETRTDIGDENSGEPVNVRKAREQTQETTAPR